MTEGRHEINGGFFYLSEVLCRFSWLDPDREAVLDGGGGEEVDGGLAVLGGSTAAVADDVEEFGGGGEGVDLVACDAAKRCVS